MHSFVLSCPVKSCLILLTWQNVKHLTVLFTLQSLVSSHAGLCARFKVQAELKKRFWKWQTQSYLRYSKRRRTLFNESSTITQISVLDKSSPKDKPSSEGQVLTSHSVSTVWKRNSQVNRRATALTPLLNVCTVYFSCSANARRFTAAEEVDDVGDGELSPQEGRGEASSVPSSAVCFEVEGVLSCCVHVMTHWAAHKPDGC